MENEEPLQPEEVKPEKPKSIFWGIIKKASEYYKVVFGFLGVVVMLTFWYFLGETPESVSKLNSDYNKLTNCIPEDTVRGTVQLNNQALEGAIISLKVHNKNTDAFEEKENQIKVQNENFTFSFCKANSDKVEFKIIIDANTNYVKPFSVDSIPTIINLN
jgi:hypothetical protein